MYRNSRVVRLANVAGSPTSTMVLASAILSLVGELVESWGIGSSVGLGVWLGSSSSGLHQSDMSSESSVGEPPGVVGEYDSTVGSQVEIDGPCCWDGISSWSTEDVCGVRAAPWSSAGP